MDFKLIHKIAKLYQSKASTNENLTYKDYFGMAMIDLKENYDDVIKYLQEQEPKKPALNLKDFFYIPSKAFKRTKTFANIF